MTNNTICFVCGAPGAACILSTKPQTRGAYFTFLTNHALPEGADLPDSNGFVSACFICKTFLTEQWNSYERHKTPIVERIFWLKRLDDQAFTGAEINVQGELVAQYIGINNNGISAQIDDMFDHSSRDSNKVQRKTASFQGMNIDTEDTSSSFDDISGVLDLSTSPRKHSNRFQSQHDPVCTKILSNIRTRNITIERKSRTRQNSTHNNSTFVCYICRGTFVSPQKSRFLSCSYTSDDEPYFPFVQALAKPDGAKEITKSGLAEVCCDCRKSLSRQWRVFETRNIPIEKRVYDVESLINLPPTGNNFCINDNISSVNSNLGYSKAKNSYEKPKVTHNNLPKCFACLQATNALKNIDDKFLRSKSVHAINLLPLSKKLLEMSNSDSSDLLCCEKCFQFLLLERRVLDQDAVVSDSTDTNKTLMISGDHSQTKNSTKPYTNHEFTRSGQEIKVISSQCASESNLSSPDISNDYILEQNKVHSPKFFSHSSIMVCFLCGNHLDDADLLTIRQKTSVIHYLITLTSAPCVKWSSGIKFCGECSDYLLPSLLKDFKHSPSGKKAFNNGGCESTRCSICFYCLSKEETREPSFLSVKIEDMADDAKSMKVLNLFELGVREIVACRHCLAKRNKSRRKASDISFQRSAKIARNEFMEDVRQEPEGHAHKKHEGPISWNACPEQGVEFMSEHENASRGRENQSESPDDPRGSHGLPSPPSTSSSSSSSADVHLESVFSRNETAKQKRGGVKGLPTHPPNLHPATDPIPVSPVPGSPEGRIAPRDLGRNSSSPSEFETSPSRDGEAMKRLLPFSSSSSSSSTSATAAAFMSGSLDPPVRRYRTMNQLLLAGPRDDANEKHVSHLQEIQESLAASLSSSGLQHQPRLPSVLPHSTTFSIKNELHDNTNNGTRNNSKPNRAIPDGTDSKPAFYRPFSDDDDKGSSQKDAGRTRNGLDQLDPDGSSSSSESPQPLPRASNRSPSAAAASEDVKDERLTAALGLISLCHSKFSTETTDFKDPPRVKVENSSAGDCHQIPRSGSLLPSYPETDPQCPESKKFVKGEVPPGDPRTIHWPGVQAILDSYDKHLKEMLSQKKSLLLARNDLLQTREELVHSKNSLETSLKDFFLERRSLMEGNRLIMENIVMLKSCLTNLSQT